MNNNQFALYGSRKVKSFYLWPFTFYAVMTDTANGEKSFSVGVSLGRSYSTSLVFTKVG